MTEFPVYFNQNYGDVLAQRNSIIEKLSTGPARVSEIAEKTNLTKQVTMWNLLGLLRWGKVEITGEEHHELVFGLKEV
ncbi:MAG: hypothetical protein AM324_006900 [Candidatus Thorarchaeota archaeon SMTZ1-83]|nr:MAG: hypothetical protein AM324_08060 [Candidatus Thorarchaeota archaeon SMTZ1-83]